MLEDEIQKKAVALSYEPGEEAPKVVASGRGYVAEKILQKAKEANIPVHQDEQVADVLSKVDIGEYIPQELYEVVAEILVFVGDMEKIRETMTR